MKARFLHLADCHLGYKQYNRTERFNDFAKAFLSIIQVAIDEQVDFVILAGDLFQKRAIDALTLDHAINILTKLKTAGIPCIVIEGNHELSYYDEYLGWVQFLARQQLLTLLTPKFEDGVPLLTPYKRASGAYVDPLPGIRIYGLKYQGASTARMFAAYGEALEEAAEKAKHDGIEYTIFMAHTGVEGVLASDSGGLSHRQLAVLKPYVDYLALGHVHKPFEIDGWIYNPGSPETCSFTEASWPERGYFLVDIDTELASSRLTEAAKVEPTEVEPTEVASTEVASTEAGLTDSADDAKPRKHIAKLYANQRRPFLRYAIKVDHHHSPEALFAYSQELLTRKARDVARDLDRDLGRESRAAAEDHAPVVELLLSGVLPFERADLDLHALEDLLYQNFQPLYAQVRNLTRIPNREFAVDERLSRAELEQQVLSILFSQDARYSDESDDWAQMAISLKNLALSGGDPESILDSLSTFLSE